MKLLVQEDGTDEAQAALEVAEGAITSRLTLVETRSALVRMSRGGRLSAPALRAARQSFDSLWGDLGIVDVPVDLIERAAQLADLHALRAYDALHLASAVGVATLHPPSFACWDRELRTAAGAEQLDLVPPAQT